MFSLYAGIMQNEWSTPSPPEYITFQTNRLLYLSFLHLEIPNKISANAFSIFFCFPTKYGPAGPMVINLLHVQEIKTLYLGHKF